MKKKVLHPLTKSKYYGKFSLARNYALESILHKHLRAMDIVIFKLKRSVLEMVSYGEKIDSHSAKMNHIERRLEEIFNQAESQIIRIILMLRRVTYALAYIGETEAIARVLPTKKINYHLKVEELQKKIFGPLRNVDLDKQVHYRMQRLKHKVLDAIHLGMIMGGGEELPNRIDRAFPRERPHYKKIKWPKLKEAKQRLGSGTEMSMGFIDDAEWDNILDNYFSEIPIGLRGPEFVIADEEDVPRYVWEVEQELTDDFVRLVREGKVDAATENGVTDLQWIAVIDNKTCECCCVWKDGLSSKEIEGQMKDHPDDEEETIVPPAHFNCRCDVAPMTDAMPEEPPDDLGDFETWLK
jgi:SPP1 gp7 family putative phage head morphogenesis protein